MTTDSPTLAPCPFCGGEAAFGSYADGAAFVNCTDCEASVETVNPHGCNRTEAAAAWNRRPDRSPAGEVQRPDIEGSHLVAALRQEGYLVPYPIMLKAMQAAALSPAPAPEREGLVEALRWYEALARDCRKVTDEGERARHTLEKDQGSTARAAIAAYEESRG